MDTLITSRQNNLVKYIRGLADKKTRDRERRLVIEGARFIADAVAVGHIPVKLVVSEAASAQPAIAQIISMVEDRAEVVTVSDSVMRYMAETDNPQGILALVPMPAPSLDELEAAVPSLLAVIDGVQDPGNVGTIIRTADAFGAGAVLVSRGSADIYNPKTMRSTMGSLFHMPVVTGLTPEGIGLFLEQAGSTVAVTSLDSDALALNETVLPRPLAVVFGSEARGVSAELMAKAGLKLRIPMGGLAESLNVAVAAGIILYESFRQNG